MPNKTRKERNEMNEQKPRGGFRVFCGILLLVAAFLLVLSPTGCNEACITLEGTGYIELVPKK